MHPRISPIIIIQLSISPTISENNIDNNQQYYHVASLIDTLVDFGVPAEYE